MSNTEVQSMLNNMVEFFYEGNEVRTVKVEVIKTTDSGKTLIIGRDEARNKQYRSFDVTKMKMAHII
jgi:hypothetical protein